MIKVWVKEIDPRYYICIERNQKVVEGRLKKGDWTKMVPGQVILWKPSNNPTSSGVLRKILWIEEHNNFEEMIIWEGLRYVLPDCATLEDAVAVHHNIYGDHTEKILSIGMGFV